jgi:hypothetical protein
MSLFRQVLVTLVMAGCMATGNVQVLAKDCDPPLVVVPNPSSTDVPVNTRVWFFLRRGDLTSYRMAKGKLNLWRIRKALRLEEIGKRKRIGGDLRLEAVQQGGAVLSYGPNKHLKPGGKYLVTIRLKSNHTLRVAFAVNAKSKKARQVGPGRYLLDRAKTASGEDTPRLRYASQPGSFIAPIYHVYFGKGVGSRPRTPTYVAFRYRTKEGSFVDVLSTEKCQNRRSSAKQGLVVWLRPVGWGGERFEIPAPRKWTAEELGSSATKSRKK